MRKFVKIDDNKHKMALSWSHCLGNTSTMADIVTFVVHVFSSLAF